MPVDFIDRSGEAIEAMSEAIEAALEAIGNQAVSHAKSNIDSKIPRHGGPTTGSLKNSISHAVATDENTVYIGTNNEYAIYNEFGTGIYADGGRGRQSPWSYKDDKGQWHRTRGITPIHFLKNAVQEHIDEYQRIAEAEIKSHQP